MNPSLLLAATSSFPSHLLPYAAQKYTFLGFHMQIIIYKSTLSVQSGYSQATSTHTHTQLFFSSTPVKSCDISHHCHFLLISFLLGDGLSATKKLLDSGALRAVLDATNKIYNTLSQRKIMLAAQMKQDPKLQNLVKQLAWFMVNVCRQTENTDLSQEDVMDIYRAIAMFVNDTDNLEVSHQDYSISVQQQIQGLGREIISLHS